MSLPHVTSFCGCFGLELGAKFIGVMHVLASLLMLGVSVTFASRVRSYVGTVEDAEDLVYSTWYYIAVAGTLLSVCHLLLASSLLYAAFKRSWRVARVWVVVTGVLVAVSFLLAVVSFVRQAYAGEFGVASVLFAIVQILLFYGFTAYCIVCVNSYYLMVRSSEEMDSPNKTDY